MDVVFLDIEFIDWPVIDFTAFFEQVVEAASEWAYQYSFSVLRYPDQVILEAVGRVRAMFVAGHDDLSMPYFLEKRQDFVFSQRRHLTSPD